MAVGMRMGVVKFLTFSSHVSWRNDLKVYLSLYVLLFFDRSI